MSNTDARFRPAGLDFSNFKPKHFGWQLDGKVAKRTLLPGHPRMKELINPGVTAGGSLFASRRSGRASRSSDGPLTPLNYRLREGDFRTLDHLVEEFGASSRGHLITRCEGAVSCRAPIARRAAGKSSAATTREW